MVSKMKYVNNSPSTSSFLDFIKKLLNGMFFFWKTFFVAKILATKKVFQKKKIPFRSFFIKSKNEEALGELFTYFILETILLARALKINPYDQPAVELIKIETKKLLKRS